MSFLLKILNYLGTLSFFSGQSERIIQTESVFAMLETKYDYKANGVEMVELEWVI